MPSPTPPWYAQLHERLRNHLAREDAPRDSAHDLGHLERVARMARHLAEREGAHVPTCLAAGLLHDVVHLPKHASDRGRACEASAELAQAWCLGYSELAQHAEAVADAIATHSYSGGRRPRSLEAAILQDADRLDAMGAVGIARVFATAGAMGSGLWHGEDPWGSARGLDDRAWALDHFARKLLRLGAGMHTATAREEARIRHRTLLRFLAALGVELAL